MEHVFTVYGHIENIAFKYDGPLRYASLLSVDSVAEPMLTRRRSFVNSGIIHREGVSIRSRGSHCKVKKYGSTELPDAQYPWNSATHALGSLSATVTRGLFSFIHKKHRISGDIVEYRVKASRLPELHLGDTERGARDIQDAEFLWTFNIGRNW